MQDESTFKRCALARLKYLLVNDYVKNTSVLSTLAFLFPLQVGKREGTLFRSRCQSIKQFLDIENTKDTILLRTETSDMVQTWVCTQVGTRKLETGFSFQAQGLGVC